MKAETTHTHEVCPDCLEEEVHPLPRGPLLAKQCPFHRRKAEIELLRLREETLKHAFPKLLAVLMVAATCVAPATADDLLSRQSVLLGSALLFSTLADAESTTHCNQAGTCRELNPLLLPIAKNRPALYTVKLGFATGVWVLSARMRGSQHRFLRIVGWLLPLEMIALQSWAAGHNWRVW